MSDDDGRTEDDAPPPIEEEGGMPVEEGAPLWMTTFGDLMSLLLTFFVLLFSMSEIKAEKFAVAAQSFREATGGTALVPLIDPVGLATEELDGDLMEAQNLTSDGVSQKLADEFLDRLVEEIREFIAKNALEETFLVTQGPSGVRLRIAAGALFRPGSGTIDPESEWIIDFVAELSDEIDVPVNIAGHADNQPIRTAQFRSNWELSAYRAAGIARMLAETGVEERLLRVESFGSAQPVATNDTPEGRAENRRVEFFYDRTDITEEIERWRSTVVGGPEAPASGDAVAAAPIAEGNPGGA